MGRRLRSGPSAGSPGAMTHWCDVTSVREQAQTGHPQPMGHPEHRAAERNKSVTGGPGTPCSPETPTSPLGPWGGMERSEVSVGVEQGYKSPWRPEALSPGTRQGMGTCPLPRETPWEDHPTQPPSVLPPPFCPQSPLPLAPRRGRYPWIPPGRCQRCHPPACPACRAPRGRRGGLCVPAGEEEDGERASRAEQRGGGSVLTATSPGATLPAMALLEVTVPARSLAAPGLLYLQSLQSLGALGTRWAAGRALGGRRSTG